MAQQTDLSQLKHIVAPSAIHLYYETQEDGTNVLRHIRVNRHTIDVPAEGITIDTLPAGSVGTEQLQEGSVGSEQIEDSGVGLEDLSPDVIAAIEAGGTVASESDVRQIVTDYE